MAAPVSAQLVNILLETALRLLRDSIGVEARLGVLERTLTHVGVEHRLEGNRLLAADPEGRIVLIQGVRGR